MNCGHRISLLILVCYIFQLVISGQSRLNQHKITFKPKHNLVEAIENNPDNQKNTEYYDEIVKHKLGNLQTNLTENKFKELQQLIEQLPGNLGQDEIRPCTCGVFLSNHIKKKQILVDENPTITQELEKIFPCTRLGARQCQNECFQVMIKYLPKSAEILCALVGEDIHKLRAHLFVQNCDSQWHNSNLRAGREYCCKDGLPYNCPLF